MQTCSCTLPYEQCCGARTATQPQPIYVGGAPFPRYVQPAPPTLEQIREAVRDELKKAGVI